MAGKVPTFRVGVDIGGTFTDIVLLGSDGAVHTKKISSSVGNYAEAIVEGLLEVFAETGLSGSTIDEIRHGTTVASNAILEHKGARVGLITTKGFRDVLELRTLRMPRLYDMSWEKPPPLVERYLRRVVDERVDAHGGIERALDETDAQAQVDALLAERVETIAVCLINSFANPVHELAIKAIIASKAPDLPVSISYEVLPEIKEYERTSTTVINAYVMPIVATYLRALRKGLDAAGVPARLLLMQSNGGLTTDQAAAERPMNIIESGPAGGVVGAEKLARAKGFDKIITFDMGGTTAKASMVESGQVMRAQEQSVGAGIMASSRLLTGAGYTLKVPAIDLAEIGAGGGSHVRIDAGGALQVGPDSAGALPGPVCYGKGGTIPTVTDASVVLGYVSPTHLVGGALKIDAQRARDAYERLIAKPLGLSLEQAALGAYRIATSNMIRAIRAVSIERGRDPRGFALFAFGGNGPLFACDIAQALGVKRVVVPPAAGLFSSFGLLYADVEHHFARTFRRVLRGADLTPVDAAWQALAEAARAQLAADGFPDAGIQIARSAALHYKGQSYELVVPVPDGRIDAGVAAVLEERFGIEHERIYGHRAGPDEPVELVSIQVIGRGMSARAGVAAELRMTRPEPAVGQPRPAYFGAEHGWVVTPVVRRSDLKAALKGPAIVEEYDATVLVAPGATASLDSGGNIGIDL